MAESILPDRDADAASGSTSPDDLAVVRRINLGLQNAWRGGLLTEPPLDADNLVNIAVRKERQEIQGGHWEQMLGHLTEDLEREARLNPLGRTIAHGLLVRLLRHRIRAERIWRRHPDIRDIPIKRPVIILGHMRSGTTRLHRLLACDPLFTYTRFHEGLNPLPRTRAGAIATSSLIRRFMNACNPQLRHIHPVRSCAAEEEFGLHAISLHGAMFEAQWRVPTFARRCEARELGPVYEEFHGLLQILRWRRRERPDKVQLLKAPQFMEELGAVLREFPDARVIRLERDRRDVVASSASLVWNQRRVQSDIVDAAQIGLEWKRKTDLRERRASSALATIPSRLLTVGVEDTDRDWKGEVRRIYDFLGLPLSSAILAKMARSARAKDHKSHHYSPARFGLAS